MFYDRNDNVLLFEKYFLIRNLVNIFFIKNAMQYLPALNNGVYSICATVLNKIDRNKYDRLCGLFYANILAIRISFACFNMCCSI